MDQPALNNVFPLVTPVQRGPAAPSSRGRQSGDPADDNRFRDALDQQRSTPAPSKRREQPPTETKSASRSSPASPPPSSGSEPSARIAANDQDDVTVAETTQVAATIEAEVSNEATSPSDQKVRDESTDIPAPIEQSLVALAAAVSEATQADVSDQAASTTESGTKPIPSPKGLTDSLHASLPKETAINKLTHFASPKKENSDAPQSAPAGLAQAISAVSKVQTNDKPSAKAPIATQESLLVDVATTDTEESTPVELTETSIDLTQSFATGDDGPVDQQSSPSVVDEIPADVVSEPSTNAAPVSDELAAVPDEVAPQVSSLQSTHHQTANPQATESRRGQPTGQPVIEDVAAPAPVEDSSAEEPSDEGYSKDTTTEIDKPKAEINSPSQRDGQAAPEQSTANDRRDVVPPATPDTRTDRTERRAESRSSREGAVATTKGVAEPNRFASRNTDRAVAQTVDTTVVADKPVVTEPTVPVATEQPPSADLQSPEFLQALDAIATTRVAGGSSDVQAATLPPAIRQVQSSFPQPIIGNEELVFDLTPPELGRIRIELRHGESGLVARFETETPAARQLITEHIPALRESLQQQGAVMERVEVRGRDDGSALGQFSQSFGEQTRDQRQQPDNAYVPEAAADEPTSQQPRAESATTRRRDGSALNIRV